MSHPVMHFTHVRNLPTILATGLWSDNAVREVGTSFEEVGNTRIKDQRRQRQVPIPPGGVVADYVPFYFAPRSPMMFSIHKGNVPTYQGSCDELVYICSTVERLQATGCELVFTDRNAVLTTASFQQDLLRCAIDWPLMKATLWANTEHDPDRRERRMAECLVHESVPTAAISGIVTKSQAVADEVARLTEGQLRVAVRPNWYF